jgi:hypothetical protein
VVLFPAINALGVRAQYPNGVTFEHLTNATNLAPGPRVAFAWRPEPLGRYTLKLTNLTDAEVATLEAFFISQQGRYGQFAFIDPTGNLLQYSEDFTQSCWTKACTVGAATADPFGGTAATVLAANSGNSSVQQAVVIDPEVSGSQACFSVYLMAVTAAGAFNIYATDGATTVNVPCSLTTTAWTRVSLPWTFGASGAVTVGIGGNSSWTGASQVAVYGPMLSMTPGAAPYLKTPGFAALRPFCRFDQDALEIQYKGPNQSDLTLKVAEIAVTVPMLSIVASGVSPGLCSYIYGGSAPPIGWQNPIYVDSTWGVVDEPLGSPPGSAIPGSSWVAQGTGGYTSWQLFHYHFTVPGTVPAAAILQFACGQQCMGIYLNGTLIYTGPAPTVDEGTPPGQDVSVWPPVTVAVDPTLLNLSGADNLLAFGVRESDYYGGPNCGIDFNLMIGSMT